MSRAGAGRDFVLATDIGGTKVLVSLVDREDRIVSQRRIPTEAHLGPRSVVDRLISVARELLRDNDLPLSRVLGVGISSAGPSNSAEGVVFNSPNLPGWHNVPLVRWVEEEIGLPTCMGNDASLAALAENVYGAGRGVDNMIYVTVSTGIGGGIIVQRRLYTGGIGTAGEIGHTILHVDGPLCSCGRRGCLESFSAGWALAQRARRAIAEGRESLALELAGGKAEGITAETLFEAAQHGDTLSKAILDEGARYLGAGLANLAILLDPEMIVIGGGLSIRWDDYVGPAVEHVHATDYPVSLRRLPIVPAKLGDEVSVMGAVALARRRFGSDGEGV